MSVKLQRRRHSGAASMRGLSLVELMVGVAIGLFVVAAAALLVSSQLSDNRRLLLETQLQQDLRASADIVTRELRRAGYWSSPQSGVPSPGGSAVSANPYLLLTLPVSANAPLKYNYRRGSGAETFGFRLDSDGVLRACQTDFTADGSCSNWQDLTDGNTVEILNFAISSTRAGARARTLNDDPITLPCAVPCADPANPTGCWPKVAVREVVVTLTGRSRSDTAVVRSLSSSVRVRNDRVDLSTEAAAGQSCPAS